MVSFVSAKCGHPPYVRSTPIITCHPKNLSAPEAHSKRAHLTFPETTFPGGRSTAGAGEGRTTRSVLRNLADLRDADTALTAAAVTARPVRPRLTKAAAPVTITGAAASSRKPRHDRFEAGTTYRLNTSSRSTSSPPSTIET
ncbi:hypothetical protein GCM10017559_58770 [Streptosporangium longisporum]|uniref:Uncharacterized protein n=1 Tax=Streptosporangium longisporum TaxID=46187 RepID=A0ABP6L1H1_9ACTN